MGLSAALLVTGEYDDLLMRKPAVILLRCACVFADACIGN